LLLNLEAVFTAAIAWGVFHENIDGRIAAGLIAIVAGGVVLSWKGSFAITDYVGPFAIAAASLCWGIDNNFTQKISRADPVRIASVKGFVAGTIKKTLGLSFWQWGMARLVLGAVGLGVVGFGGGLVVFITGR